MLRVWDFSSGDCFTLRGHESWVNELVTLDLEDGMWVLTASDDMSVRLWNIATRECVRTWMGHSAPVQCVRVCGDPASILRVVLGQEQTKEPLLVTGALDNTVRVWNMATGHVVRTLFGHVQGIWSLSTDHHRTRAVSASADGTCRLWDLETGACLLIVDNDQERVLSPDECMDREHAGGVTCIAMDEVRMITASEEGGIRSFHV
jgi:F-box/WD-40 domain protein MET30